MWSRGFLRTVQRQALARWCAGLIIALVLCPFTAPFASYDPNASPIGSIVTPDGSVLDKACDKAVSADAVSLVHSSSAVIDPVTSLLRTDTTTVFLFLRSVVLRI
jgi:hypothetical protein